MTSTIPFICASCVHRHKGKMNCDAYPDKPIPLNFLKGEEHFTKRDDQDNDVVYGFDGVHARELEGYEMVWEQVPEFLKKVEKKGDDQSTWTLPG